MPVERVSLLKNLEEMEESPRSRIQFGLPIAHLYRSVYGCAGVQLLLKYELLKSSRQSRPVP